MASTLQVNSNVFFDSIKMDLVYMFLIIVFTTAFSLPFIICIYRYYLCNNFRIKWANQVAAEEAGTDESKKNKG
jgi:hypothetical protein